MDDQLEGVTVSRDPLPEPWRSALEPKGIHSKRGLASKIGVSPQTAKRLIDGIGSPSSDTVNAVADEFFNGDRAKVWELAGLARQDHGDFRLPPEASQLDPEQRAAVLAVVRAMLPPGSRRGEHGGDTAAIANDELEARRGSEPGARQQAEVPRAARRGKSAGKARDAALEGVGEESQDDGGFGPV